MQEETIGAVVPEEEFVEWDENIWEEVVAWDGQSGEEVNPREVRKARSEEMGDVSKHQVYTKVPLRECWENFGKGPIQVGEHWKGAKSGGMGRYQ